MADLHMFRIEDGENFWYAAEDSKEALNLYMTDPEIPAHAGTGHPTVVQEPDDVLRAADLRDDPADPLVLPEDWKEWGEWEEKDIAIKTWKQWADERGKGYFACTV